MNLLPDCSKAVFNSFDIESPNNSDDNWPRLLGATCTPKVADGSTFTFLNPSLPSPLIISAITDSLPVGVTLTPLDPYLVVSFLP